MANWAQYGLVAGLIGVTALVGCANSKTDEAKPAAAASTSERSAQITTVNSMCPIGAHEFDKAAVKPEAFREYKGTRIGFCCADCSEHFDTMTAAEKDQILALAKANKAAE